MRTTILHVITGLGEGGAQRMLHNLVRGADRRCYRHIVASLRDGGPSVCELQRAGVDVAQLGWNHAWDTPLALARLRKLIQRIRPDIVQSWLYHADLAAALTAPPTAKLIWSLRNSDVRASGRASWGMLVRLLAPFSARPDVIVSNSERGLADHRARGYRPREALVIANGVDLDMFKPSDRAAARARLGLPVRGLIVGMAARRDPFKDHAAFLEAARIARAQGFDGVFALAGAGTEDMTGEGVIALGPVTDIANFYAALDIATLSSSHGEGFPNAVVEAMACAIPVVATDSGDSARILAEGGGAITPPRDPQALARAWLDLARKSEAERAAIGAAGRSRAEAAFDMKTMVAAYEALYARLSSNK